MADRPVQQIGSTGGQLVLRTNDNTGAPFYFVTRATF